MEYRLRLRLEHNNDSFALDIKGLSTSATFEVRPYTKYAQLGQGNWSYWSKLFIFFVTAAIRLLWAFVFVSVEVNKLQDNGS